MVDKLKLLSFIDEAEFLDYRNAYRRFANFCRSDFQVGPEEEWNYHQDSGKLLGFARLKNLPWDTKIFGVPSARIEDIAILEGLEEKRSTCSQLVRNLVDQADEKGTEFLSCRISAAEVLFAHALEEAGFRLCDAMNIYCGELQSSGSVIKDHRADACGYVEQFLEGYEFGRFFEDPMIDVGTASRALLEATQNILKDDCHVTVVREVGTCIGMAIGVEDRALSKSLCCEAGVLWLILVDPKYRNRGVGKKLLSQFVTEVSARWQFLEIGTQVANYGANQLYLSAGFPLSAQALTFHRWQSLG